MPSQNKKFALVSACATQLATDAKIVRAEQQTWQGDHYALAELSIQYQGIDAAEALAEARDDLAAAAEFRCLGIADAAEQESARSFTQRLAAELAHGLERA
ncbi:hypothetical protein [Amycolatopsis thermoflava]|uniref:hypothetical protein n=1 Tax=Amycolatopsis thermoflava TaxID=84480 RepID=UPI0004128D3B|nr:hypothetical protein [Amycolatopsis thermoflava]